MINRDGEKAGDEEEGLLLYDQGTVCLSSDFVNDEAEAICKKLGFAHLEDWNFGTSYQSWPNLADYEPKLGEISCRSNSWDSCEFVADSQDCDRYNYIFLTCHNRGKSLLHSYHIMLSSKP